MPKFEIDIEGLPEGWKAISFRMPMEGEWARLPNWTNGVCKLLNECKELNPWMPIETAPKDESEILLYVPGCYGCEIGRWSINLDEWSCYPYIPTHWQELPNDPE